jgi:hypothetical protein
MTFKATTSFSHSPFLIATFLAPQMKTSVALVGVACISLGMSNAQELTTRGRNGRDYSGGYGGGYDDGYGSRGGGYDDGYENRGGGYDGCYGSGYENGYDNGYLRQSWWRWHQSWQCQAWLVLRGSVQPSPHWHRLRL